jgi:uncharacterized protein (DUF427 family)
MSTLSQITATDYELFPSPKRIRVLLGGRVIADTRHALLLRREKGPPVYYFPLADLQQDVLQESGRAAAPAGCGEAQFYTVHVDGSERPDAAWRLTRPAPGLAGLGGHVAFDWNAMDGWFEEEQEVFVHPRDPRKRIDITPSSAHVRVLLEGETVAESHRPTLLFETGLATRYYLPRLDVRQELLQPSERVTRCPYKGEARYYSLRLGETLLEDVLWHYRYTTLEASPIAGLLCFYQERIVVEVDGRAL